MRKVWVIAWICLLRIGRDKTALLILLLMPMILTAILGFSLRGVMDGGRIEPFDAVVVNADHPARPPVPDGAPASVRDQLPVLHYGQIFVDEVLPSTDVRQILRSSVVADLDEAKASVLSGRVRAAIHIPADFTETVLAGNPSGIQVFTDPGYPTQGEIVLQIVRAFSESLDTRAVTTLDFRTPRISELAVGSRSVSAMQYYSAAMMVMFMLFTAFTRARVLLEDRQTGTLDRILTSPTDKGALLAGQVIGTTMVLLGQLLILMTGTGLLFGVYWGPVGPAIMLGVALSVGAAGISTASAALMRDPRTVDISAIAGGQILAALSGGMFPLYYFPDSMKLIAKLIPNYWALQGYLDQMAGAGMERLWQPIIVLIAMGAVAGTLGTWRLSSSRQGG